MNKRAINLLEMLEQSQILVNEVDKIFNNTNRKSKNEVVDVDKTIKEDKLLSVRIIESGNTRLNFDFPLNLVKLGRRFLPKEDIKLLKQNYGIDINEIVNKIKRDVSNRELISIYDEDADIKVEIYIS